MKIFFEMDTEKDDVGDKLQELRNIEKLIKPKALDLFSGDQGLTSKDMAF